MRDILIPANDHTSQIDYIIICSYGIFVGEIKTFHGFIIGSASEKYWKQYINGTEKDYYNPIFQNRNHIHYLQIFLKSIPTDIYYHSLIFMKKQKGARLQITPPYPPNTSIVTDIDAFMRIIQVVCEKREMIISLEQAEYIFNYIISNQIHGQDARILHANYAQSIQQNTHILFSNGICPQCKSKLIVKTGKYGKFWGCSNYPQCKYTHKY